jgi:hypothetical protein
MISRWKQWLAPEGGFMRTLNPTLLHIGERLRTEGERTLQTAMPWRFLDLLCQLEETEEAAASNADDAERERLKWLMRRGRKSNRHRMGRLLGREKK